MDRLTEEEILAVWFKLRSQQDYCMSGVTRSRMYQAKIQPLLGYTSKIAL